MKKLLALFCWLALCGVAFGQQSYVIFKPAPTGNPYYDTNIVNTLISNVTFKGNITFINPTVTDGPFIDELNGLGTNLFLSSSAVSAVPLKMIRSSTHYTNLFEITNSSGTKIFSLSSNAFFTIRGTTVNGSDSMMVIDAVWANQPSISRTGLVVTISDAGSSGTAKIVSFGNRASGVVGLNIAMNGAAEMDGPLTFNGGGVILQSGSAATPAISFSTLGSTGLYIDTTALHIESAGDVLLRLTNDIVSVGNNTLSFGSAMNNYDTRLSRNGTSNLWIAAGVSISQVLSVTNGVASYSSNLLAVTSVALSGTPALWTNTFTKNVQAVWSGGTVSGVAVNNSLWSTPAASGYVILQPGEWLAFTNTGVPEFAWKPF